MSGIGWDRYLVFAAATAAVLTSTDIAAETITYKFDPLGRLTAECYATQAKHIAYSYDAAGNRTSVVGAGSCANQPPVALDDVVTGTWDLMDGPTVSVLANDGDPDGNALTVTAASCVSSGCAVSFTATTVTIVGNTHGSKTATYTISDGNGGTDQGSLTASTFIDNCPLC